MKDRKLVDGTRGTGRSVHSIQQMPPPAVRNADLTTRAIMRDGTARNMEHVA